MILHCNYEELTALRFGARSVLAEDAGSECSVLAPPESRDQVEALLARLEGELPLPTLWEVWQVAEAVEAILESLRLEMETQVLTAHAADENAVAAYFDFAHVLTVAQRLREMVSEMEALIELVTGVPATPEVARTFRFPD